MVYGDLDALEELAASLRQRAQEVRDRLSARMLSSETAQWQSAAADAYRAKVREETRHGAVAADRLDEAAAALLAHAQRCREVLAEIAAIEAKVSGWFQDRYTELKAAAGQAVDGADQAIRDLSRGMSSLPAPGQAGWLEVPDALRRGGLW